MSNKNRFWGEIMYFENSKYKDMKKVCINRYGETKGNNIYENAEKYYKKFLDDADYRNSEVIKDHMVNNIFPVLAYYMSLLDEGLEQSAAYDNVLLETQRYAKIAKDKYKTLGSMIGAFFIFRLFVKKIMSKNFPNEGWETEWVKSDGKEVSFNLKRCVYHETVDRYGHPELCTVFCKNDTTSFSGLLPKIRFERSGTIGEGKKLCDFHFINNKGRIK